MRILVEVRGMLRAVPGLLNVYGNKRVLACVALGIASGLPYDLLRGSLSLRLTQQGIPTETIGVFFLILLVFNLKVAWAPIVDRWTPGFLCRRRGWIVLFQLLLVVSIFAMGVVDPRQNMGLFVAVTVVVAFFSASQDIVIDAYRTDVLPSSERGAGAAAYVFGYRVAMILGGGLVLILSDYVSWRAIYMMMSMLMLLGVAATVASPPVMKVTAPRTLMQALVEPLKDFFGRLGLKGAMAALFFLMFFKFGEGIAGNMLNVFLSDPATGPNPGLGFSGTEIGSVRKILGMVATMLGAFAGGSVIAKWGTFRPLLVCGIFQSLANVGYLALAFIGPNIYALGVAISVDNFLGGMGTTAFVAYLMSLCSKQFSAFQFALFTSVSTLLAHSIGAFSGFLQVAVGWPLFFLSTIVISAPALVVLVLAVPRPVED